MTDPTTDWPLLGNPQIDRDDFARAIARVNTLHRLEMFRPGFSRRDLFHGRRDGNTISLYQFAAGELVGLEVRGPVSEPVVHLTATEAEALGRELLARARIARALETFEDAEKAGQAVG